MVDVADRWRERNVWYPGRSAWNALKGVTIVQGNETMLSMQKSAEVAEVIVVERRRTESIGVFSTTGKGGRTNGCRKQRKLLAKE